MKLIYHFYQALTRIFERTPKHKRQEAEISRLTDEREELQQENRELEAKVKEEQARITEAEEKAGKAEKNYQRAFELVSKARQKTGEQRQKRKDYVGLVVRDRNRLRAEVRHTLYDFLQQEYDIPFIEISESGEILYKSQRTMRLYGDAERIKENIIARRKSPIQPVNNTVYIAILNSKYNKILNRAKRLAELRKAREMLHKAIETGRKYEELLSNPNSELTPGYSTP